MKDIFELKNNGADLWTELTAGATTFIASMYIIIVNPAILADAGFSYSAVQTATVLVSAFSAVLMGLYSNNPMLIAPGMGINSLLVAIISRHESVTYQTALGCVFYAGLLYLALLILDRRRRLLTSVPRMLRYGVAGGIGIFIAQLGLISGGFLHGHPGGGWEFGAVSGSSLTFIIGFFLMSILVVRKVKGALLIGAAATTILAWPIGRWWGGSEPVVVWSGFLAPPDFSLFLQLDLTGPLSPVHWPLILVLFFIMFFDSYSTCVGVAEAGDLVDQDGFPRDLDKSLKTAAIACACSGLLGTSPATAYVESATGVRAGGRTGLTAMTAGLLFLPFLFFSPLLTIVPSLATAPILVLTGVFMLKPLIYVRWERYDEAIPFFIAMVLNPLTNSISQGVIWGCLCWTAVKASCGKFHQVPPLLLVFNLMALILLVIEWRILY